MKRKNKMYREKKTKRMKCIQKQIKNVRGKHFLFSKLISYSEKMFALLLDENASISKPNWYKLRTNIGPIFNWIPWSDFFRNYRTKTHQIIQKAKFLKNGYQINTNFELDFDLATIRWQNNRFNIISTSTKTI